MRGPELRAALAALPPGERDAHVDDLLGIDGVADDVALPAGSVPYLPCGVDAIVRAVDEAPVSAGDVFVDFGAGVGRVCLLVHLLTEARCVGVELQSHLVDAARAHARRAAVSGVEFVVADAGDVDVAADVGFVYASFGLPVLRRVLERQRRGRLRTFCAVGFDVDVPWLRARPSSSPELSFYDR